MGSQGDSGEFRGEMSASLATVAWFICRDLNATHADVCTCPESRRRPLLDSGAGFSAKEVNYLQSHCSNSNG